MILKSAVSLTHNIWPSILYPGAYVIDATCGNGHDTLFLSQNALTEHKGKIIALDIQEKAIENTSHLLKETLQKNILHKVKLLKSCHSQIDHHCPKGADLIVYNLGYLPGADKTITTQSKTTLLSLKKSLLLLNHQGILSITCYPGHPEGQVEALNILNWAKSLGSEYDCCQQTWINRSDRSPFILLIGKKRA